MDKVITDHLVKLSDSLDKAGKTQCSNAIDGLIQNKSIIKIAQYVGAIGYVLKQNRAMSNCVRKKRVAHSGSMQEVVLDCLKEYQDGQEYGNNEWTAKYAKVIEQTPEYFDSLHADFLKIIASENNISDHITKAKEASSILVDNEVEDDLFKALQADLNQLDNLFKEGDADPRPFKLAAAPRSQRGLWSRLFSPSGTARGVQKDTELEMDNILEGISSIAMMTQQIRNNISMIQYQAASLGQYPNVISAAQNLSSNDWNKNLQAIQSLQSALGTITQDPSTFRLQELSYNISNNMSNIYSQVERIQRNMFNLRQRDPIKGRTYGPSTAEEFGQLEMALEKLIRNPFDDKALFYAQKLHGRLEDALNMRPTELGPEFQEWIETHPGQSQFEPQPEFETETGEEIPEVVNQPQSPSEDLTEDTAQQLTRLLGPGFTNALVEVLGEIARMDYGSASEAQNLLSLIQELNVLNAPNEGETSQESENITLPESEELELGDSGGVPEEVVPESQEYDADTILDLDDWNNIKDPREAASRMDTLIKIADIADVVSPRIANIIDEYIKCSKLRKT